MALTVTDCTLLKMHMYRKIFMLLHLLYDGLVQPSITAFGSASKNEDMLLVERWKNVFKNSVEKILWTDLD